MKDFNKLTVIAPSIESSIGTKMYGYEAANAVYGNLKVKPKQPDKPREPQIRIISGYMGSLATAESRLHAEESIEIIADILEKEFRIDPDMILRCDDADLSACIVKGKEDSPKFHTGFRGAGRIMGLVGDQEAISVAAKGLEEQNIASEVFKVRPPFFGCHQPEETQTIPPIDFRPYALDEEVRLVAGDE